MMKRFTHMVQAYSVPPEGCILKLFQEVPESSKQVTLMSSASSKTTICKNKGLTLAKLNARRRRTARDNLVGLMVPVHMREEREMPEQEKA